MMRQLTAILSLALLASGAMAGSWEVMNADKEACLLLEMNLTFTVPYTLTNGSLEAATFDLSSNATVDNSSNSKCGKDVAKIKLDFLTDYSIMFEFQSNNKSYNLQSITLDYVLDSENFPNAKNPDQESSLKGPVILFTTDVGYSYRCNSEQRDQSITGLTMTFSDVKLQPFGVTDGKFSNESICGADEPTTTGPMTTGLMTTASNVTSNTTIVTEIMTTLNDNSTTEATTTPVPPLPPKYEGNWTVHDANNTACMYMAFNATFSISYTDRNNKTAVYNGNLPHDANSSKSTCNETYSAFVLLFNDTWEMRMVFEKTTDDKYGKAKFNGFQMNEFYLNYTVNGTDGVTYTDEAYTNETYFKTSVNKTYLCNADQLFIAENAKVTFSDVTLQPFANGAPYPSNFEDCSADGGSSNIVPIAVGCALAGLVVIVLIAYLIGRKRTKNVGYQTV